MYNVTPPATFFNASAPTNVNTCAIIDASALLYQPALRAAVIEEQAALLATRLAVARWTSGMDAPAPAQGHPSQPYRAAFYARAQEDFLGWIARGGMWEADTAAAPSDAPAAGNEDSATVE